MSNTLRHAKRGAFIETEFEKKAQLQPTQISSV